MGLKLWRVSSVIIQGGFVDWKNESPFLKWILPAQTLIMSNSGVLAGSFQPRRILYRFSTATCFTFRPPFTGAKIRRRWKHG
jgi:hypothetical protein